MEKKLHYSAICNCGNVRRNNQDRILIPDRLNNTNIDTFGIAKLPTLMAVFDGMGGEQCGDKASETALKISEANNKLRLDIICRKINQSICRYMKDNGIKSMGTTAAMVRFSENEIEICNIGDSRIYLIDNESITQLSVDHTVNIGTVKPRRVLTQHLGIPEEEMLIEPYCNTMEFSENSTIIICSDGLTDMLSDKEIQETVCSTEIKATSKKLYDSAMENGGTDNISIIAVRYGESNE